MNDTTDGDEPAASRDGDGPTAISDAVGERRRSDRAPIAVDPEGIAGDAAAVWLNDPTRADAAVALVDSLVARGQKQLAAAVAQGTIALGVRDAALLRALGTTRLALREYAAAADALRASLDLARIPDTLADLAGAYLHLHRDDAAIAVCEEALALAPRHATAANNLGIGHNARGDSAAAIAAFERAIAFGSPEARTNLGTTRLLLGDYARGWPDYGSDTPRRRRNPIYTRLPMWDGALAPTDRLLIWPEQGVGDTFQMVRFLREARPRVGSITLACQPGTRTLLESVAGVDDVIDVTDEPAFKRFDQWLPTIRLPVVFNADPTRPPTPTPTPTSQAYLFPDAQRTARFAARFAGDARVRVGLVWAGSPDHAWDDLRSCPLAELEAVRHVAGVAWYALQTGAASADEPRHGLTLAPLGAELADYADTAAALTALHLLITVDTSVAHLAGALGKPAWVMLSNRPDWRWQLTGSTSPWYPALRLFRQGVDGTWPPVVAAIAAELTHFVAAQQQRGS